jgi:hypothetical protein
MHHQIADLVRSARSARNWSHQRLAREMGYAPRALPKALRTIRLVEDEGALIQPGTMARLFTVLGLGRDHVRTLRQLELNEVRACQAAFRPRVVFREAGRLVEIDLINQLACEFPVATEFASTLARRESTPVMLDWTPRHTWHYDPAGNLRRVQEHPLALYWDALLPWNPRLTL